VPPEDAQRLALHALPKQTLPAQAEPKQTLIIQALAGCKLAIVAASLGPFLISFLTISSVGELASGYSAPPSLVFNPI
jgi:hypothetical protein